MYTYFLRATSPATISGICGCSSGSPPGIDTIGVPHSSTALKHCSGVSSRLQNMRRILDLAAARARQVAAKQRLQHQHQRIPLAPRQLLLQHVARYRPACDTGTAMLINSLSIPNSSLRAQSYSKYDALISFYSSKLRSSRSIAFWYVVSASSGKYCLYR